MTNLPIGTVTFMFTDIEDSTGLARNLGDEAFTELLARHHRIIRENLSSHSGLEVATEGDSVFAVFTDPVNAVMTAVAIQVAFSRYGWEGSAPTVRIGLHTGNGVLGGDNYSGVDVHKASRVASSGHGGQIVVSDVTAHLVADRLLPDMPLKTLGRYRLAGFAANDTLHQVDYDGHSVEFPSLRARRAESHLPTPLSEFIGRETEMAAGEAALAEHRLLTLTGPGGTGKTRLSIALAHRVEEGFPDGAYFVPLAAIRDSDLLPTTILDVLGLTTAGGVQPSDHLERFLAERSVLLVLDNFEQLVDGAAYVSRLLERTPETKVIVTSRVPLRVAGEREMPVPPLDVPDVGGDASHFTETAGVQLFAKRASAVRPDFHIDEDNIGTIATITRSLDGLPLAIELAASRIRSLTPELILERLGNQLLTNASSDLPERQQTIVKAIGWSYDLLDEPNRRLFEKLSVFTGSFGLREAEIACAYPDDDSDVLDGITQLVEQSLLRQTETAGEPRFRMLTVVREFGYAALVARGDEDEMLDRHTRAYLELAERSESEILTSRQAMCLRRLSADHDNLRAVYDRALTLVDRDSALRLVGALWRFWQIRGHLNEGADRIEGALALPGVSDPIVTARALTGLGGIRYWQGHWDKTLLETYQHALELFREAGDEADVSEALYNVAFPLGYANEIDRADACLRESLAISERIGREIGRGRAYWGLANLDGYREEFASMISNAERSIEIFAALDAPFDLGWAWFLVAQASSKLGELGRAREALRVALDIFAQVTDVSALALIIEMEGLLALQIGDRDAAFFLAGAAQRLKTDTGVEIGDVEVNQYPEIVELMHNRDEQEEAAFEMGRAASLEEVIAEARRLLS